MKKTMTLVSALLFAGAIVSVEVLPAGAQPAGCENVGTVKAGDRFATLGRRTAVEAVKAEALEKQANKIALDLVSYNHGKLGKQYSASAVAYKCN